MKKTIILTVTLALGALVSYILSIKSDAHPVGKEAVWLECDSALAVENRLRADFALDMESAIAEIRKLYPEVTDVDIDSFISRRYIETRIFDGDMRVHRKSPKNIARLNPSMNGRLSGRGDRASEARISYADSVLNFYSGKNSLGGAHKVTYRFSIDVPYHPAIAGDTLRVWMPFPIESERQNGINILSAKPEEYIVSEPGQSVHRTIYFSAPVAKPGEKTHFEYTASFITSGSYTSPDYILENILPYNKNSDTYRQYTATEAPHIVRLDSLASEIAAGECNPYLLSERVYDYINKHYLWAGAREYSTIDCIPEYVIREGHGDCGQVALLYISLMRTLGIPARWESGWMLHPGEKNLHDWAEVYFEGVGWIPVDPSFGRYTNATEKATVNFYSTGIDAHRFASNRGICGNLYPEKRFIRSETVDFQLGEVETSRGNLFYPAWEQNMQLIDVEPYESVKHRTID